MHRWDCAPIARFFLTMGGFISPDPESCATHRCLFFLFLSVAGPHLACARAGLSQTAPGVSVRCVRLHRPTRQGQGGAGCRRRLLRTTHLCDATAHLACLELGSRIQPCAVCAEVSFRNQNRILPTGSKAFLGPCHFPLNLPFSFTSPWFWVFSIPACKRGLCHIGSVPTCPWLECWLSLHLVVIAYFCSSLLLWRSSFVSESLSGLGWYTQLGHPSKRTPARSAEVQQGMWMPVSQQSSKVYTYTLESQQVWKVCILHICRSLLAPKQA